jgi:hypothetical protein
MIDDMTESIHQHDIAMSQPLNHSQGEAIIGQLRNIQQTLNTIYMVLMIFGMAAFGLVWAKW